jgi:hypothetical protein
VQRARLCGPISALGAAKPSASIGGSGSTGLDAIGMGLRDSVTVSSVAAPRNVAFLDRGNLVAGVEGERSSAWSKVQLAADFNGAAGPCLHDSPVADS